MYAQIGGAIPALIEYRDDFEKNQTLATALQDYYEDILKFHEEAIYVFARPSTISYIFMMKVDTKGL